MAQDVLSGLSPTYRATIRSESFERRKRVTELLTPQYRWPLGETKKAIATLRAQGYDKPLTRDMLIADREMIGAPYDYFHIEKLRNEADQSLKDHTKGGYGRYLSIHCLLLDNPDIKTWEDVEAKAAALAAEQPQADTQPDTQDLEPYEGMPTDASLSEDEPPPLDATLLSNASIRDGNERMTAVAAALTIIEKQFLQLAEQNSALTLVNARLQSENSFLKKTVERYNRAPVLQSVDDRGAFPAIKLVEKAATKLTDFTYASANGLPHTTTPDNWYGKVFTIYYYDAFRQAFSELSNGNKKQMRKNLHMFAKEGRLHPSFKTEKMDTKRGWMAVPSGVEEYLSSRASLFRRIAWSLEDNTIRIYTIAKKSDHP